MKRILLFIVTNMAVLLVFSIVVHMICTALGMQRNSTGGLLILAAVFGFGGAFISLALSKWLAIRSTKARVIQSPKNETEQWLLTTVQRHAQHVGIKTPQIAIYPGNEMNAFATGATRHNALIAVSSGLLQHMSFPEVEAVLGHEISHIANGDMVTLALIQGILNTFVIFTARIIATCIDHFLKKEDEHEGLGLFAYMAVVFILEILLGFFASMIVMWFSRQREYRADQGGSILAGQNNMINALKRLQQSQGPALKGALVAFGINGKSGITEWFMSHPPIEKRITALQNNQY